MDAGRRGLWVCAMPKVLKDQLKYAVENDPQGRKERAISVAVSGKPDLIRDILRGKVKNPRAETIHSLAKELGTTFERLTGHPSPADDVTDDTAAGGVVPVRVVGVVQAGAFMDPDDGHAYEHDTEYIGAARDRQFPGLELFAFRVIGDSIDKVCKDGGYALCVDFAETGLMHPRDGSFVVAERQRGGMVERTVKRVQRNGTGYELHPDSNNPKHRPIRFPSAEPSEEVRVIALVRWFQSPA